MQPKHAKTFGALVACALLLIAVSWGLQSANRARINKRCEEQLELIGVALTQYSNDHKLYPLLSPIPGQLMFSEPAMYPRYLADRSLMHSPALRVSAPSNALFDDTSYYYLGYLMLHERSGLAWIDEYRTHAPKQELIDNRQEIWPDCLPAIEERKRIANEEAQQALAEWEKIGGDREKITKGFIAGYRHTTETPEPSEECVYLRLENGVERFVDRGIGDPASGYKAQAKIPVLIERPELHGDGGHVLYMDGHVAFMPYPGKFPMTSAFIDGLRSLDALEVDSSHED